MPKTKRDWLVSGMQILVGQGVMGLTIENLCRSLDVTKGSFYHHFKNQPDYQAQLLAFWQEEDTRQVVAAAGKIEGNSRKIDSLIEILGNRSAETANPELAIRAWALQNENVRGYVEQVDKQRIELTTEMLKEVTGDKERAHFLARMMYAMLVGSYSIIPPIKGNEVIDLYQEFTRLYAK